jgi:hypothetical protein
VLGHPAESLRTPLPEVPPFCAYLTYDGLWRELLDHAGRVQNDGGDCEGEEGEPEREEDPVGHCVVSVVRSGRPPEHPICRAAVGFAFADDQQGSI